MRFLLILVVLQICVGSPVWAGVTVSSFQTVALNNAYAPLSRAAYFDKITLTGISPANLALANDWSGTNKAGMDTTWHTVMSATASSTTTFNQNSLVVSGSGSFGYDLTTTSAFVDPAGQGTVFSPGAAGNYECYFTLDTSTAYDLSIQLTGHSTVRFFLVSPFSYIVNENHLDGTTMDLHSSGMIKPGQYGIQVSSSFGVPNLNSGVNHVDEFGSFDQLSFSVQVPEPIIGSFLYAWLLSLRRHRLTIPTCTSK
jgi:hypothetical protein